LRAGGRVPDADHSGGQCAISLISLAFLKVGDHVLIPESVYTQNRNFAVEVLRRFGVEVGFYAPEAGAEIQRLFRENTRMVWCESPGSITLEVQDVPSIAAAAHRAGVMIALDNTWSAGVYFDAFVHGVDVTMQALTKYAGGHSDLLLGSITTREETAWRQLGNTQQVVGCAASPADCSLALRGLKTLAVRLKAIEEVDFSALAERASRN
jgi:cystathionine beta-lyase